MTGVDYLIMNALIVAAPFVVIVIYVMGLIALFKLDKIIDEVRGLRRKVETVYPLDLITVAKLDKIMDELGELRRKGDSEDG